MAVLRGATKGQLGKYVVPTVEILNTGRVSTPRKTYTLKRSDRNTEAIKRFLQLGVQPSSEDEALNITLETTDSRKKTITIGSINKPNVNYNFGDMAEGIVGAAICARFIYKNRNIRAQNVYGVLNALAASGMKNYSGKKGKYVERTFKSANANPKVMDDVRCYISLAEVNMAALLSPANRTALKPYVDSAVKYANSTNIKKWSQLVYLNNRYDSIEVESDGLGGQKTTKVDVSVKITDADGNPMPCLLYTSPSPRD